MTTAKVVSVNISEKKGVIKRPVNKIIINKEGIENDAHAGDWHRQVSLLAKESIDKFEEVLGRKLDFGEFAENITTEGITLYTMKPGDRLKIADVEMEVTQIGKECHGAGCAIFTQVGKCVMPKEGIFAKVIQHGVIKPGDEIIHTPTD
ncbi:MAG: MOSC domain-containing protein [Thiohalospira sp.]